MPKGQRERLAQAKLRSEALVNVGRNYNGPKVAKFLVGLVPSCTNHVTMPALSQRGVSTVSLSISHEVVGPDAMIFVF